MSEVTTMPMPEYKPSFLSSLLVEAVALAVFGTAIYIPAAGIAAAAHGLWVQAIVHMMTIKMALLIELRPSCLEAVGLQ